MTTEELVTRLKELGVEDEYAEGFRDMRLQVSQPGGAFRVPVPAPEDKLYRVNGYFTGEDAGAAVGLGNCFLRCRVTMRRRDAEGRRFERG